MALSPFGGSQSVKSRVTSECVASATNACEDSLARSREFLPRGFDLTGLSVSVESRTYFRALGRSGPWQLTASWRGMASTSTNSCRIWRPLGSAEAVLTLPHFNGLWPWGIFTRTILRKGRACVLRFSLSSAKHLQRRAGRSLYHAPSAQRSFCSQEILQRCPVPVLEIMMDSVLASSVDYSLEDGQGRSQCFCDFQGDSPPEAVQTSDCHLRQNFLFMVTAVF